MEMMRKLERDGDDARVSNNRLHGERDRERQRKREIYLSSFTKTKLKERKREMEEIRKLAMIYYAKLSNDEKQWTRSLFKKIDVNGDGKVTVQEFFGFFITGGSDYLENLFMFLDKNQNGTLDFEECVTFFYMIASNRLLECDGCGSLLLGAYYLCVECYNANREETYNLCCSCYSDNNFSLAHAHFLDNYALLLKKEIKNYTPGQASSTSSNIPSPRNYTPGQAGSTSSNIPSAWNYTPGQAGSTRSNIPSARNYTPGQASSTRSKLGKYGKYVELADTLTNYDNMDGFVDNMVGLVCSTLSKSVKIKDEVQSFLYGYKIASTVFHAPAAAHFIAACAIM